MIARDREEQILQRAIERGLIAKKELQQLESSQEHEITLHGKLCWGIRIDRLLRMGRLTEAVVKSLDCEIENRSISESESESELNRTQSISEANRTYSLSNAETMLSGKIEDVKIASNSLDPSVFDQALFSEETTLTPDRKREFPISNWDRYKFIKILGEGGMGAVYQALDPKLNRFVALKFIRGDNSRLIKRFFQEAKAQARIEHEYVCKVYEVGEVEGKPYIAMQYIAGESVQSARSKMSLEQKVKIIKDTCGALHAAHRLGIIHRDIKPANIMVEQCEDGTWYPQVMDFGLARDLGGGGQGLTETGMIMGTPSYMSPEQARGDLQIVDRRADIYSLGATLYELLTDRPPFDGSNFETLTKVVNEDPVPLRKVAPSIPKDLETITMKCLEKEPQRRYDSAKALAEDLQRYLDGEPIAAQHLSWSYKIVKQAKKHRVPVTVAGIALLIVMVLIGVTIRERLNADEKARLAQQFGQEAERIEGILQRAYLLPIHDISSEQALVKDRMNNIRDSMHRAGRIAAGAGYFALGRGYLALHDYEQAKLHLELARKSGYEAPEVTYALGQVMGNLYRKSMEEAERIASKELREARKKKIEKDYREPALNYLNEYMASSTGVQKEEAAFVQGQIAFYKKEYGTALSMAKEAYEQAPWLYEARKLEGDVYIALGKDKIDTGDYEEAISNFDKAGEAYARASEIGRSDAMVYTGDGERWIQVMEVDRRRGRSFKEAFENVLAACDRALQISPDNAEAYNSKSRSYWRWGEYQDRHGEDPRYSLDKAVEMAQLALEKSAREVDYSDNMRLAYENLSNAYRRKGEYDMRHALDPLPSLDMAIETVNKAIKLNPNDISSYNTLGLIYDGKGIYERNHGQDPNDSWDKAIEAHKKSTELNPQYAGGFNNMGIIYVAKAQYEIRQGKNAEQLLERAIECYEKAIQLNPNLANGYIGIGQIFHNRGLYLYMSGQDPRQMLDKAIENYQKAIQLNANNAYVYNNLSYSYELKGKYETENGRDPTNIFNDAREILERSIKIDPSDGFGYSHRGMLEIAASLWMMRLKQNPVPFLERARQNLQESLKIDSKNNFFYQAMAELNRREAEWRLQRGERPQKVIEQGLSMIDKSLEINPRNVEAVALKGALVLLDARSRSDIEARARTAQAAKKILETAIDMNKLLRHEYGPLLEEADKLIEREN
jgi:eukaryotic-like serine/threonine-protein kinase